MQINNVSVTITKADDNYGRSKTDDTPLFQLSASITSDSREFLERVAQAIHKELANPEPSAKIGSTFTPGMGT
jgi:hypothetical protein